jgi:hypothetical protein
VERWVVEPFIKVERSARTKLKRPPPVECDGGERPNAANVSTDGDFPLFSEDSLTLHENGTEGRAVCRYFAAGECFEGSRCRFSHESIPMSNTISDNIPCRYFLRGECRLGDNCHFSHKHVPPAGTHFQHALDNSSSKPACRFFQSLRGCKNPKCEFSHVRDTTGSVDASLRNVSDSVAGSRILEKYSSVKKAEAAGSEIHVRKK